MFDLPHLIETVGYVGLFGIIFAESGILIGLFLPGDSLLFTTGFLASQGYLNIWILIPVLYVAAFLGDSAGYWIGHKMGPKIFIRPESFWFKPDHVEKTRRFFEKYGARAVVLARFVPIVRTFVPVMAGVGEMHYSTFVRYNAIGAFLWACGITILGFIFGNIIPNADRYILPIVGLIVMVSFIPAVIEFWRERKNKKN